MQPYHDRRKDCKPLYVVQDASLQSAFRPFAQALILCQIQPAILLQLNMSPQPTTIPIRPLHRQHERPPFLVPLITANSVDTTITTIFLSRHRNAIPSFTHRDDLVKPDYPFKCKSHPPRTPIGGFVSSVIKAVSATETEAMGRWVEGEKEEKSNGRVADKGALEGRKDRHLRLEKRTRLSVSL